jgi:hypothetical protein
MKTIIELSREHIEKVEFEKTFATHFFNKIYPSEITEFFGYIGKEHHRLLAYLSTCFNDSIIIDVLTEHGQDALALSYNPSNTVMTFSHKNKMTESQRASKFQSRKIELHEENLWNAKVRKQWKDHILSSSLIFVDVDPHDGYLEYELYAWLKRNKYTGMIVFDDITHFDGMRNNLWSKIEEDEKYDISFLGHFSGTGLVIFPEYSRFEIRLIN